MECWITEDNWTAYWLSLQKVEIFKPHSCTYETVEEKTSQTRRPFYTNQIKKWTTASRKPQKIGKLNGYLKKRIGSKTAMVHKISVERMGSVEDLSVVLKVWKRERKWSAGLQYLLELGGCLACAFNNYTHNKIVRGNMEQLACNRIRHTLNLR